MMAGEVPERGPRPERLRQRPKLGRSETAVYFPGANGIM